MVTGGIKQAGTDAMSRIGQASDMVTGGISNFAKSAGPTMVLGAEATANQLMAKARELENAVRMTVGMAPAAADRAMAQAAELKKKAELVLTQAKMGAEPIIDRAAKFGADTVINTPKALWDTGKVFRENPNVQQFGMGWENTKKEVLDGLAKGILNLPGAMLKLGIKNKAAQDEFIKNNPEFAKKLGVVSDPSADFTGEPQLAEEPDRTAQGMTKYYKDLQAQAEGFDEKKLTTSPALTSGASRATGIKKLAEDSAAAAPPTKTALELYRENQAALGGGKQNKMIDAQRAEMKADRNSNFWNNVGIAGMKMASSKDQSLAGVIGAGGEEFFTRSAADEKDYKKQKSDLRKMEMDYQGQIDRTAAAVASGQLTADQAAARNKIASEQVAVARERARMPPDRARTLAILAGVDLSGGRTPTPEEQRRMVGVARQTSGVDARKLQEYEGIRRKANSALEKMRTGEGIPTWLLRKTGVELGNPYNKDPKATILTAVNSKDRRESDWASGVLRQAWLKDNYEGHSDYSILTRLWGSGGAASGSSGPIAFRVSNGKATPVGQ